MTEFVNLLSDRLAEVRGRIASACARVGRDPAGVTLVAVTKSAPVPVIRALVEGCGVLDCGENRPQQLWSRAAELAELPIRWHMIGTFQRNKVARTLPLLHRVHSIDSVRLRDEIVGAGVPARGLLQVNGSGEAQKQGFDWAEAIELGQRGGLTLDGLMTMAADSDHPEEARPVFRRLRELGMALGASELSMGMSGDYEVAIEEGATMIRVGSALFAGPLG